MAYMSSDYKVTERFTLLLSGMVHFSFMARVSPQVELKCTLVPLKLVLYPHLKKA